MFCYCRHVLYIILRYSAYHVVICHKILHVKTKTDINILSCIAAPSRRGDLEILGFCMLQWLCGKLPWEDKLLDKNYVADSKFK